MEEKNKFNINLSWRRMRINKDNIPFSIVLLILICIIGIISWEYYILFLSIFPICFIYLWNLESYVELYENHMVMYIETYNFRHIFKKKKRQCNILYKDIEKIDSFFDTRWHIYRVKINCKSGYLRNRLYFFGIRIKDYNKFKTELQLHYVNIL